MGVLVAISIVRLFDGVGEEILRLSIRMAVDQEVLGHVLAILSVREDIERPTALIGFEELNEIRTGMVREIGVRRRRRRILRDVGDSTWPVDPVGVASSPDQVTDQ